MNLTEEEIRERAREIFNKYDEDGSGQIDFDELKALMTSLHIQVSDEELTHMAAELDVDGSAEIEILEFEEMLFKMYHSKDKEVEKAREVFNRFDKDDSGALDPSEFRLCLRDLGEKLTEGEFRWLLAQIDKDGTGQIEFEE
ncbi:hypothetical protein GUITHDRAFT_75881 [Guillardia theta CCMP2712]|uniref:EF-hand domain-containing protein n=1 Tax=Guillardia theta (strain CCMP2712) TaxID=905079 RepID=L1IV15_GUITC|nr:hypothetical protein GUITHDRAFT_75881 [Guillardia theta CCMP2712]EKX40083.1 hypothetical protein GUITHDRAFT_75881 [Guillardia theta CCMP2712]|eukprot:XP_005827063.1 hypothetical protein GUITHDRAFT_75881 [Guillardia theta CCMP2712]